MENHFLVLSTDRDKKFAEKIAKRIDGGNCLQIVNSETFNSGEVIAYPSDSVRAKYVFIVHQYNGDVNSELMRVLTLIDACKRASAEKIFLIDPFVPYLRQDYRSKMRQPITAKLIGEFFAVAGLTQLITLDMHSKQAEGLIGVPVIHIGGSILCTDYLKKYPGIDLANLIISSADVGGASRAKSFAEKLDTGYVLVDKTRPKPGEIGNMVLIGDVTGKDVIIVDDMTDTGGTIIGATDLLYEQGARNVYACITHLLHKSKAINKLGSSRLKNVFVTNSFVHKKLPKNFQVIPLEEKLAEIITDILAKRPVKA